MRRVAPSSNRILRFEDTLMKPIWTIAAVAHGRPRRDVNQSTAVSW